ncbi:MAG: aminoglycoside phosphotransferase, partial [Gammaproteobacteria bacterium]
DFHNKICIADPHSNFGSTQQVMQPVEENFSILKEILSDTQFSTQLNKDDFYKNVQQILNALHKQILSIYQSIVPLLQIRKESGFIRECHGDLHLGNIALIEHKILLFDGIEFNDNLRWIDTISDCAFLIMDLQDQQQFIFAHHFLNQYLSKTGDYSSLSVIKFYQLYRAMVRAKVAALRLQQQKTVAMSYKNTLFEIRSYLELAQSYVPNKTQKKQTFLAISFGISGSGKSWLSSQLADNLEAIQLRSDIERKRLFLQEADELYSNSTTQKTYTYLMKICEIVLNAAYPVIVDATFLDKKWRREFCKIAEKLQIPFHILSCYADLKTIIQRLKIRQQKINNISDADIAIMKKQLKNSHQLEPEEKKYEISINTTALSDCSSIIDQIQIKNKQT